MTNKSDFQLIERACDGETAAFEMLYLKYKFRVKNVVARILYNQNDIEDIVQVTFMKAFMEIKSFRRESSFFTWLFIIASNSAKVHYKKRHKDDECLHGTVESYESSGEIGSINSENNPEEIFIALQLHIELNRAFMALPETLRVVFFLREIECLSYEEISREVACPIGTVRSRIHRAREDVWRAVGKGRR